MEPVSHLDGPQGEGVGRRSCFRVSSSVFLDTWLPYLRSGLSCQDCPPRLVGVEWMRWGM